MLVSASKNWRAAVAHLYRVERKAPRHAIETVMFNINRIDRSLRAADEPLGSKQKFWFYEGEQLILFKADDRGTGEDWAEKITCHLCELLGLPHVHYELAAEFDGDQYIWPGIICESCAPQPPYLILGNQLLFNRDPNYPKSEDRKYKVREHTVSAVVEAVRQLLPPSDKWSHGMPVGCQTALDDFIGYVMLDAWVANQDRHHENWGALSDADLRLAPTFDHGASLARNLNDTERHERLMTKDRNFQIPAYARRARSAFYSGISDSKALGTFEAFWEFGGLAIPAARLWVERLKAIEESAISGILAEIPSERMTELAKRFTLELLMTNQKRLVEESARL